MRLLRLERRTDALLGGLFAALAYLTYTSSYITLPLLLGFVALECLVRRSTRPARLFLPSLVIFAVVMLPFVVSALTKDNFFLERVGQINTLSGEDYGQPVLERGDQALAFFIDHVSRNVIALYEPGHVAWETGYLFGKQALFSPLGLALFALGSLAGLYRAIARRERGFILVSAAIVVAFISGMILTMPAGGLHRLSLVYPLVGLSIAAGAFVPSMALDLAKSARAWTWPILRVASLVLVVAYFATSLSRGIGMVDPDQTHDSPYIAQLVEKHVPRGEPVAVAYAFNYHLARELFFRSGGREYVTMPLWLLVEEPQFGAIVLAYPTHDTLGEARASFPTARFVSEVDGVPLINHVVLLFGGNQASGVEPWQQALEVERDWLGVLRSDRPVEYLTPKILD